MAQDVPFRIKKIGLSSKSGECPFSFATFVANEKILLDNAGLNYNNLIAITPNLFESNCWYSFCEINVLKSVNKLFW